MLSKPPTKREDNVLKKFILCSIDIRIQFEKQNLQSDRQRLLAAFPSKDNPLSFITYIGTRIAVVKQIVGEANPFDKSNCV